MRKKLLIYAFAQFIIFNLKIVAQSPAYINLQDTIYDSYGLKHDRNDMSLDRRIDNGQGMMIQAYAPTASCTAGYFEIHFEVGSGMDGPSPIEASRRAVVCQVYSDISNLINSPLTNNPNPATNKAIVAIRAFSAVSAGNTSALGLGASFYIQPLANNFSTGASNFLDCEIMKTITTGTNSYFTSASPLFAGFYYHSGLAFNFTQTLVAYHYALNTPAPNNQVDFYTLVLHEALHGMGFNSLINFNGSSKLGGTQNYSRYDSFLRGGINNVPLIGQNNGCNIFATFFAASASNLSPGGGCGTLPSTAPQFTTNCTTAAKYAGNTYTVPLFTPPCFNNSTLSHFEDMCYPTNNQNNNDQYFVMSDVIPNGIIKRAPTNEERSVLCDLGYNVGTVYGSVANLNYKTYSTGCNTGVVGVNDGVINGGQYTFTTNVGVTSSVIFPLINDISASTFTCLMVAIGAGTISNTSGTSFTFKPALAGLHLLQYYPVNANGKKGNFTYVFIFAKDNCPQNCSIMNNGGFENGINCGSFQPDILGAPASYNFPSINCWTANYGTVDYFVRNCATNPNFGIPTTNAASFTNLNTWNWPATGNNKMLLMAGTEGAMNHLAAPLLPGNTYQLSYKLRKGNTGPATALLVAGSHYPNGQSAVYTVTNIPSYLYPISFTSYSVANTWTTINVTFTYNGTVALNYLNVANLGGVSSNSQVSTAMVDDFNIIQLGTSSGAPTFTLPTSLCMGQSVNNLTANISPTTALNYGGYFNGPGVAFSSGQWNINLSPATVTPGVNSYNFIYTNPNTGCSYTTVAQLNVFPSIVPTLINSSQFTCISFGQTATLVALGSPSVTVNYNWQPGNMAGAIVLVSPTTTTIYTLTASNAQCTSTLTTIVSPVPPITFTNLPGYFCKNAHSRNLWDFLASGTPTTGAWSAPGLSVAVFNPSFSSVFVSPTITPGTYSVSYAYTAATGCTLGAQFTVNVINSPTLTGTSAPYTHCSNINGYLSNLTATATPSTGLSYTWLPGGANTLTLAASPTVSTVYTLSAHNGSCYANYTATVNVRTDCCGATSATEIVNYILNPTVPGGTVTGITLVNQDFTVTGNVSFGGEFRVAPNVNIYVGPNATLSSVSKNYVHIYACGAMWNGITVQNGGRVKFQRGDLIEDAINAIICDGYTGAPTNVANYPLDLESVVFNRNRCAIAIGNYTQSAASQSPFRIEGCVFTCRDFSLSPGATVWPSTLTFTNVNLFATSTPTHPLGSPYLLLNYTPANLKAPLSNYPSYHGVNVYYCGVTTNPTAATPSYKYVQIGQMGVQKNLFDNLWQGVTSYCSNVACYNSIIQNSRILQVASFLTWTGVGIHASNNGVYPLNYNTSLDLLAPLSPSVNNVVFYNCHTSIKAENLFNLNIQFAEFRSTQVGTAVITNNSVGLFAIDDRSNRFKNHRVENCKFLNVNTGVRLQSDAGNLNLPGYPNYGQFWDKVSISNNYFSSAANTFALPGSGYMYYAVYATNLINNSNTTFTQSTFGIRIQYNTVDRVWNGVYAGNFGTNKAKVTTANNYVKILQQTGPGAGNPQRGINHSSNIGSVINSNTITAFSTSTAMPVAGIYASMNGVTSIQCNSLNTLPKGQEFAGLNSTSTWRNNTMNLNGRGLQLSSNGIMGQQGSPGSPSDNVWQGSWSGRNGTWTDGTSFAINSKIYKRAVSTYDPPNNFGVIAPQSYFATGTLFNGSSNVIVNCQTNTYQNFNNPPPGRELIEIAGDTLNEETDGEEINEFLVYWTLDLDSLLLTSNDTLQGFYDDNTPEEVGALAEIERSLGMGDFVTADALINAFEPESNVQGNYKKFYRYYHDYKVNGDSLDNYNLSDLEVLAYQCPFRDGQAIYRARALFEAAAGTANAYNDDGCDTLGYSSRPAHIDSSGKNLSGDFNQKLADNEKHNIKRKIKSEYKIFPNPAVDEIYIKGSKNTERLTLFISDVSGRQLFTKLLLVKNYQSGAKLELNNGVYFVTLINQNNERFVKKLIISK